MSIYENEEIVFGEDREEIKNWDDDQINHKYLEGDVRIVTEQARYPLNTITILLDSGNYELNPIFQRRHRWDNQKRSRLIESFIMNVPIPPIFLYENEYSHYEVMDGLQRLTTINKFYRDEFELEGLEYWQELNGKKYSQLPEKIKQGIDRRYISSIILLQETAKDLNQANTMKQLVFERINNGGIKLEGQETRNAIYNGKMNQLCLKLSENQYLHRLLMMPLKEDFSCEEEYEDALITDKLYSDMTDVEYVLRYFAMRQIEGYSGRTLKSFLDIYLKKANILDVEVLEKLESNFNQTVEFVYELLGENAFQLWRKRKNGWKWLERPTTSVYDAIMFILNEMYPYKEELINKKDTIREQIKELYEQHESDFEGRNNNKNDIQKRRELFKEFFSKYLGE